MSLNEWLESRLLTGHETDRGEIAGLIAAIDRDLTESGVEELTPEWRLAIAYSAALRTATAALAVSGFRAAREQYHYRSILSLRYTIGVESELVSELDQFRKKRNTTLYDQIQPISEFEALRMVKLAKILRERFVTWLHEAHPELME
jgi:hypothetical protein